MSARKRTRDLDDVDGDVEVESASSTFRQSLPKRSRVAMARENGGSVVSDDDDDNDDGESSAEQSARRSNTRAASSEAEEDEMDELQATQVVEKEKRHRELKDNMASEQGVIEEVYCRNFMCHSKLRIHLGPLINFIIGHNGSGKSAVLTALQMCLGGKANATNRGNSLKNLIKEGEESATLAVKIKNQGDGAYKPELYGTSITVERHFSRSGQNGYKLKSTQDRIVSTKKSDLDDILDFFAFQLDNPINVLTQDMARSFLSNSSPNEKYKFFIRGTQLEVLDGDYKLMEDYLDNITAKLEFREQDIDILRQKYEEAEKKKQRVQKTESIRQRIKELRWKHAWAQVEEREAELRKAEQLVQEAKDNVQEKTDAAEQADGAYEGQNQAYEGARRALADFETQREPAQETHRIEKETFDANTQELKNANAEERTIKENIRGYKSSVQKREDEVKAEQDRIAAAEGPEHAHRFERLEELKAAAQQAKREHAEFGQEGADLQRKESEAFAKVEEAKKAIRNQQEALQNAKQRLQRAQQEQPHPYAGYRANMGNLVRAINAERGWRSKPIGPLGKHITLLKPEWQYQLEKTLGSALESFVVICKEDADLLNDVMRRQRCSAPILIGDAAPLDLTGKEPGDGVDTILRAIDIDSHAVRNQLIINHAVDQTVLIRKRDQAEAYMYRSNRPQNVRATLCQYDNTSKEGWRLEFSRSGEPVTSGIPRWNGDFRMQSSREDHLATLRDDITQTTQDVEAAEQNKRQLDAAHVKAKQEVTRLTRRQKDLRLEAQQAADAVEAMENEIEANSAQDGKLQELERQLESAKGDLEAGENSYIDMYNEKKRLGKIGAEIKARLDAAQDELNKAEQLVANAQKRVERAADARTNALMEKNSAYNWIDEARKEQGAREEKRDAESKLVDDFVAQATQLCRRVHVEDGFDMKAADKLIDKYGAELERAHREAGGTEEELTILRNVAKRDYDDAKAQVKEMVHFGKELKDTLNERQRRWKLFRKYISARARINFQYLLSERQFRGRVLMNHGDKELDIKVEPDLSKTSDAGRATRTLSGGEKSFSTICLLLSIWEAMGSPIRCLDEFDVFMDNVNRAQSMHMMIEAARRSVGRQFILITPQAMNNIGVADDVKIHKMSDPERGQTTLPFGATQAN